MLSSSASWGYPDVLVHVATKSRVWVYGPASSGFCINVCDTCCHQRQLFLVWCAVCGYADIRRMHRVGSLSQVKAL